MEVNAKLNLIVRDLTVLGMSLTSIRRLGGQLFPDAVDWYAIDRTTDIPLRAAISLALIRHLVSKKVLDESQAVSALAFFRMSVTRYEAHMREALQSENNTDLMPVVMFEIINGQWVRMSNSNSIFDLNEQKAVKNLQQVCEFPTWSHSVCLLPVYLQLCGAETKYDELEHENIEAA